MEKIYKQRRSIGFVILAIIALFFGLNPDIITQQQPFADEEFTSSEVLSDVVADQPKALDVLAEIPIKGRAPKTGYERDEFGSGWASIDGCDTRNIILQQNLINSMIADDDCIVLSGELNDPYTGNTIDFVRGRTTSDAVQIDHVVALSDAWQKGAQNLALADRVVFANDPLNLLAVDGPTNQQKGDSDAASWLPPNRNFRCQYVARQIAVKAKYSLWVTEAEHAAMQRVLNGCEDQVVPYEQ